MKFTILSENKTDRPGLMAEHGLSIYIESNNKKILFDAGASDLYKKNSELLGVDLKSIDLAVISHGHYDHTEGFPSFFEINKDAPIYVHKDAFYENYDKRRKNYEKNIGILWNEETRIKVKDRLILTDNEIWLSEDMVISGKIPEIEGKILKKNFTLKIDKDKYIDDQMDHEQFLAIKTEKGLVVFSGCSHKGVIPAVAYASKLFDGEPVKLLVAGMHLFRADDKTRAKTINELVDMNVEKIIPVHCTGIKAIVDLKNKLGDDCIIMSVGDSYEY